MNRIAILDGYDSGPGFGDMSAYWRRNKRGAVRKHGRNTRKQAKQFRRFKKAAKTCSNVVKRNPRRSYRACMAQKLKKSRR